MTSILVVGDRASVDEELLEALEAEGIAVDRARDAMSAIAYLDRTRAEVIVAASELPEWSGLRLLRHVESNHQDITSFLVVEAGSREITRAQRADVRPLVSDGTNWSDLADVVADRLFQERVEDHRDRRHHLAVATATVLLEALDSLKRASNYRKSTDLLRETAIVSTREVVEESVCRELAEVPGYGLVWVSHYYPEADELVPQAASGMDVAQLQGQRADVYTDAGIDLETGEVAVRQGDEHVEVVVPLRNGEYTHGTIHIQGRGESVSAFERDQLGNLGRIVSRFITALEKLQDLAETLEAAEEETAVEEGPRAGAETAGEEETPGEERAAVDRTEAVSESDSETEEEPDSSTDEAVEEAQSAATGAVEAPDEAAEIKDIESAEEEPEPLGLADEEAEADETGGEEEPPSELVRGGTGTQATEPTAAEPVEAEAGPEETEAGSEDDSMSPLVAYSDTVAHELRNHINVAEAFLDLGRTKGDEENFERVEAALDRIERLTDEAAAVASDSIDPEKMGQGKLGDAAQIAWDRVEADEAALTVEEDCTVRADHDLLELLLENLFRNAVDHVGRDVHLWIGPLEDQEGFFVEDDGPGIPESERERLFGWGESGGESEGGIGLAIVDRIAENHGWTITIEDGRQGGARFEVADVTILDE